jgi:uncharacterized membrane protein
MEYRKLPATRGWHWIKQGLALYKKSPILWVVLAMIGVLGMIAISSIPVVGEPLSTLLFPVIYAGLLLGCFALEKGEELELAHLFAGFQRNTKALVTLGGITLVIQLIILGLMKMTGGESLVNLLMSEQAINDPQLFTAAIESAGISIFIGLILFSGLLLATQFAPMLVLFGNIKPLQALHTSAWLCLRNMAPLTVYGALMMSLALLASMPMMLGWFILLPLMVTSSYAAFRDLVLIDQTSEATESTVTEPSDSTNS